MKIPDDALPYRVIILCYSSDTPNRLGFGPFIGRTPLEARSIAKQWLSTEPCRPDAFDPFWTDPSETHDEHAYSLEDGETAHEIVEMID